MQKSSEMDRRWRYVKVGKFLVCVDQPVPELVRFLWLGYEENKLDSIGLPRGFWRSALKHLIVVRVRRSDPADLIDLPAFGHMGMQVHGGHKLFDLHSQTVTKVFASAVDALTAEKEIAASRQASAVAAAPRFIDSDPDLKWYCEEYIRGVHATDAVYRDGVSIPGLYSEVETCLLDLVKSAPPVLVGTDGHVNALADDGFRARWVDANGDPHMIEECTQYLEALRGWLTKSDVKPRELQLVLTHGDFSLVNAISTGDTLRFIDWEGIRPGGLYSDVYHFLFAERYYDRATEHFLHDVANYVASYQSTCLERLPELRDAANIDLTFARRLYYLERVRLMLDREVSANIGQVILKSIAMYRQFDRDLGDDEL
jgi:hypothetical protein